MPMLTLKPTPDNPVPKGGVLKAVMTRDGVMLRVATWHPSSKTPLGTVCLFQGRAEFIEKYYETIADLRRRGFCVLAFDWRGQGESSRRVTDPHKGHVGDFSEYAEDLRAIEQEVLPALPRPHFCLAHSMGGALALQAASEGRLPFERLVAIAPMLSIRMIAWPAGASALSRVLDRLGFGRMYVPGGSKVSIATKPFENNRLSNDPVRYARNAQAAEQVGAGAVGDPTVAWLAAAFRAMRRMRDPAVAPRIRLPVLTIGAGADPVVGTPVIERFCARLRAGHFVVLPGARHEILTETDAIRADFWAAFDAFVPGTAAPTEIGARDDEVAA